MRFRFMVAALAASVVGTAFAQNGAANFVGSWQVDAGQPAGPCTVELRGSNGLFGLSAGSQFCLGQLGFLNGWQVAGDGVSLLGLHGEIIGSLTVARGVLQGRMADGTVVAMTPLSGQQLATASASCIHHPVTGYCADPSDVAVPSAFPVKVKSLHPLAIRQQPSSQSANLGTIAKDQCFVVDSCVNTREGVKCHIPPGTGVEEGYASKHFIQEGTMFVGFQNFC